MLNNRLRGPWLEALVLALASALLYHIGIGFLIFLIPLQVLYVRRGGRYAAAAMALVILSIGIVRLITLVTGTAGSGFGYLLLIELFILAALMGGLYGINELRIPGWSRVFRLLLVTALAGLLSVPLILYLRANEGFTAAYGEMFAGAAEVLKGPMELPLSADQLMELTGIMISRSFLFDYFLMLTGIWWAGSLLGARSLGRRAEVTRVVDFRLPDLAVWPLILGLALVLLDIFREAGALGAIGWNTALVFLFLYGLCGMGILRHLLQRFRMSRVFRLLVGLALLVLILSPRASIVVWAVLLLLLSGLGVSETWIKYRKAGRSENLS